MRDGNGTQTVSVPSALRETQQDARWHRGGDRGGDGHRETGSESDWHVVGPEGERRAQATSGDNGSGGRVSLLHRSVPSLRPCHAFASESFLLVSKWWPEGLKSGVLQANAGGVAQPTGSAARRISHFLSVFKSSMRGPEATLGWISPKPRSGLGRAPGRPAKTPRLHGSRRTLLTPDATRPSRLSSEPFGPASRGSRVPRLPRPAAAAYSCLAHAGQKRRPREELAPGIRPPRCDSGAAAREACRVQPLPGPARASAMPQPVAAPPRPLGDESPRSSALNSKRGLHRWSSRRENVWVVRATSDRGRTGSRSSNPRISHPSANQDGYSYSY